MGIQTSDGSNNRNTVTTAIDSNRNAILLQVFNRVCNENRAVAQQLQPRPARKSRGCGCQM